MPLLTTFAGPSNPRLSRLRQGMAAFWRLEDLTDSGPNGLTLTNNVSATFTAGKLGNAATLARASSQYLSRADEALLRMGGTDFTVSAWVKFASQPGSALMGIVSKGNMAASGGEWGLGYIQSTDDFRWQLRRANNADSALLVDTTVNAELDTWYHVLADFVVATGTASIRVDNGTPVAATISGYDANASTNNLRIGNWEAGGNMDGQIDAVGIWRRVLTSDEQAYLYNGGVGLEL